MIEFTKKEIEALLYAIYYVQDHIKCDGLSKKEVGEFTVSEVKAIERGRVKLAKLLEEIE